MGLLVVGSIAYDTIETPFDKIDDALGGSSTYISIAASFFTAPIHLVGIVGSDFKQEHKSLLAEKNIDLDGLEIVENEQTFRWGGKYHYDLNVRDTLFTHLNAFQNFNPIIPAKYRKDKFVVLGNIEPKLQLKVLEQMDKPEFVICDTMNLWIETAREDLDKVISKSDVLIINDSEARLLAKEPNLIRAARKIKSLGPKYLIIKKGEHGALLFNESQIFSAPAYPLESIFDPTGAGDSFAGGFAGFLHQTGDLSFDNIKKAVIFGSTIASYTVEKFSLQRLMEITKLDIKDRFHEFKELSRFDYE